MRILLSANEMPTKWYNAVPDLPKPVPPPLHPGTMKPATAEDFAAIFPGPILEQEMSPDRWISIPEEVLRILSLWRPTPLVRAERLEQALGTPAQIWYKNESVSPAGSHKPNTSVAQAYANKIAGVKRLSTETGAGQWGSALAFAANQFGLKCTVYMVRVSFEQKPYRKSMMRLWGAEVFASPSSHTEAGRQIRTKMPDTTGSLGIAISEAIEDAVTHPDTKYCLGSVLNHVLLHQSIIGLEVKAQFAKAGTSPDVIIGCAGGGSNFGGIALPYLPDKLEGKSVRLLAVEPSACPSMTRGKYTYDFGDTAGMTPLMKMYTLGSHFIPPGIHAGGLRYHGESPLLSAAVDQGFVEATAVQQNPVFEAGVLFARTEGIVPAPESSHAIRTAIDEALKCKETGEKKVICFLLSGHGHFDLTSFDRYLDGDLEDYEYPAEAIEQAIACLPKVPA